LIQQHVNHARFEVLTAVLLKIKCSGLLHCVVGEYFSIFWRHYCPSECRNLTQWHSITSHKTLSFSEFTYQWTFMAESVRTFYRVHSMNPKSI